jgi:ABC-type nickel/cobalt efflux system permease component RcnA
MNQKMISDTLIFLGVILAGIGWSSRAVGGWVSVVSYGLIGIGAILGLWGLARSLTGKNKSEE